MGTQSRLGSAQAAASATAIGDDNSKGCEHVSMLEGDTVKMVVDRSRSWPEGGLGELEGVVLLMGGGLFQEQQFPPLADGSSVLCHMTLARLL